MLPTNGTLAAVKTHYMIGLYVNDERLKQKASERQWTSRTRRSKESKKAGILPNKYRERTSPFLRCRRCLFMRL